MYAKIIWDYKILILYIDRWQINAMVIVMWVMSLIISAQLTAKPIRHNTLWNLNFSHNSN